ncbi:SRPBCC family protein [Streptomyces sp. NPDC127098]|uniref:SRPBCC family protein n=1 Tax=Streptomyces sp. NPDC127098 TaxID=3347137 RepID=UPI0036536BB3
MPDDAYQPSPLVPVGREAVGDRWTLVFTRDLAHPVEKVWAALSEPDQLAAWAPYTADRDLSAPGEATLTMIDGDSPEGLKATVLRAEPPALLEYSWGEDVLRWELTPTATGTRLTLRHTVADREGLARAAAGWHLCLDVAERLLDGAPIAPIRGMAALDFGWEALRDGYAERLGD